MSDEINITEMNTKNQRLVAITLTNGFGNALRIYKDHGKSTLTITDSKNARYDVSVNEFIGALNGNTTDTTELNMKEGTYTLK